MEKQETISAFLIPEEGVLDYVDTELISAWRILQTQKQNNDTFKQYYSSIYSWAEELDNLMTWSKAA